MDRSFYILQARIWQWSLQLPVGAYLRVEPLCYSLNNNEIPLVTISAEDTPTNPIVVCTSLYHKRIINYSKLFYINYLEFCGALHISFVYYHRLPNTFNVHFICQNLIIKLFCTTRVPSFITMCCQTEPSSADIFFYTNDLKRWYRLIVYFASFSRIER